MQVRACACAGGDRSGGHRARQRGLYSLHDTYAVFNLPHHWAAVHSPVPMPRLLSTSLSWHLLTQNRAGLRDTAQKGTFRPRGPGPGLARRNGGAGVGGPWHRRTGQALSKFRISRSGRVPPTATVSRDRRQHVAATPWLLVGCGHRLHTDQVSGLPLLRRLGRLRLAAHRSMYHSGPLAAGLVLVYVSAVQARDPLLVRNARNTCAPRAAGRDGRLPVPVLVVGLQSFELRASSAVALCGCREDADQRRTTRTHARAAPLRVGGTQPLRTRAQDSCSVLYAYSGLRTQAQASSPAQDAPTLPLGERTTSARWRSSDARGARPQRCTGRRNWTQLRAPSPSAGSQALSDLHSDSEPRTCNDWGAIIWCSQ